MYRRKLLRAWLLAMSRFELRMRGNAGRARNALIRDVARIYADTGQFPSWLLERHKRRIAAELTDHYQRVIPYFGDMARRQMKRRSKASGIFLSLMQEWITREALRKATLIASTDADDIRNALQDGIDNGLGNAEIARSIRKVSALTPYRAATVARTETHAAATFGSIESVRQAEQELGIVMLKQWLPTLDDRTRADHFAMKDHPPIPMGEKFNVGGVLMDRPGDPSAPPEQICNCRCALIFEESTA